ncbi:sortase [Bifidobacterium sp. SO1]|uniref:sortase n=1 Tax=Bifidobacterium sp. SO1 TaxID=2809029 RepID=UPI001BDC771D|nr:sortase [Bifidobacterium sp. SO1]MBT1162578.1 class E sortase [Bifidobacterium sp. SO1]
MRKRHRHHATEQPAPAYHAAQFLGGISFLLLIICGLQIVYMYWANSFDQIHIQETVAAQTAKKTIPDVDLTSDKIAKPQSGDPPIPGEPSNESVIGWMYIPGIETGWKRAIQEGVGLDVLDNGGLGHYPNTAMPGQLGNTAYAGHRTPGDLGYVDRLKNGDAIVIQTADHWYVYKVMSSWVTTPDDFRVLDADQPNARWLTLTTCHPMIATVDASLQHRFIVRARFSYWANVKDGIPQELSVDRKAEPVNFVSNKAKQTVRRISKSAPITPILTGCMLVVWLLFNGFGWLLWRGNRRSRPVSWSVMTVFWRLQQGPLVLRLINYAFFWIMVALAVWAWLSPVVSVYMPWLNGSPTLGVSPTIG